MYIYFRSKRMALCVHSQRVNIKYQITQYYQVQIQVSKAKCLHQVMYNYSADTMTKTIPPTYSWCICRDLPLWLVWSQCSCSRGHTQKMQREYIQRHSIGGKYVCYEVARQKCEMRQYCEVTHPGVGFTFQLEYSSSREEKFVAKQVQRSVEKQVQRSRCSRERVGKKLVKWQNCVEFSYDCRVHS